MVTVTDPDLVQVLNEMLLPLESTESRAPRRKEGDFTLVVERTDGTYQITQHVPLPDLGVLMDVHLVPVPRPAGWMVTEATRFQVVDGLPVAVDIDEKALRAWLQEVICRSGSSRA